MEQAKMLSSSQVAQQLQADEFTKLLTIIVHMYGGKDFQIKTVHRIQGKVTVEIDLQGIGSRTVNL